LGVVHI